MKKWTPYLLLLPGGVLGILFCAGILSVLIQSLGYVPAFGLRRLTLEYYQALFQKPSLLASVGVSLWIAFVSSVLSVAIGVLLCAALVYTGRGRGATLQLLRLPILVPHTVAALFAVTLLSRSGLLSRMLYGAGLISGQEAFPSLVFSTNNVGIVLSYLWKEIPFVAYFMIALMGSLNATLGEAARNLGASGPRAFFHVTLPLCLPAAARAFLILFAFSFGAYELPFLLGATEPKALPVQAYVEYVHPDLRHRPYAMAMNGFMLLLALAMTGIFYALLQRNAKRLGGAWDGF